MLRSLFSTLMLIFLAACASVPQAIDQLLPLAQDRSTLVFFYTDN